MCAGKDSETLLDDLIFLHILVLLFQELFLDLQAVTSAMYQGSFLRFFIMLDVMQNSVLATPFMHVNIKVK